MNFLSHWRARRKMRWAVRFWAHAKSQGAYRVRVEGIGWGPFRQRVLVTTYGLTVEPTFSKKALVLPTHSGSLGEE